MAGNWIGRAVSIQCSDVFYQGTIREADSSKITIDRAFRNGLPVTDQNEKITINASDIKDLQMIPTYCAPSTLKSSITLNPTPVKQPDFPTSQTVLANQLSNVQIKKKINNTGDSRQNNFKQPHSKSPFLKNAFAKVNNQLSSSSTQTNVCFYTNDDSSRRSSKPIDITHKSENNTYAYSDNNASSGDNEAPMNHMKNKQLRRQKLNSQTFGASHDDPALEEDFDFEKNLALFDKQAIWDEIESQKKTGVVKPCTKKPTKYKHNENILVAEPTSFRQIGHQYQWTREFSTDDGLIIPSIPAFLRTELQSAAERHGFTWERQCEMFARGSTDLAIQLVGGARRLTPNNEHQWPIITVVCDAPFNDQKSEIGLCIGRQLATHGLKVFIYVKPTAYNTDRQSVELDLFKATGGGTTYSVNDLPSTCDLIILAVRSSNIQAGVKKWINDTRAQIMAVDPPINGITDLSIKCSILPILPLDDISSTCGKFYLCNTGIPDKFYKDVGIKYKSPFGHKFVISIDMVNSN